MLRTSLLSSIGWLPAVLAGLLTSSSAAETRRIENRIAPYFTDHTVLPSGREVPVWGRAEPGRQIHVSFARHQATATTGSDGIWLVQLPPLAPGTRGELSITGDNTSIVLKDVVAGEVWFCSGQSNMEWTVAKSLHAESEIRNADLPDIRHYKVTLRSSPKPLDAFGVAGPAWRPASPETAGAFTAVGYFFAKEIHRHLKVPIGLIDATWGGTPIHPWMTLPQIKAWEHYGEMMENKRKEIADWPRRKAENEARLTQWEQEARQATADGRAAPVRPWFPGPPDSGQYMPGQLYHAMVHPFIRFPVRGVLWYQGESNAGGGEGGGARYTQLQNRLIQGWRESWNNASLPFLFVQLAGFRQPTDASGTSWAFLREGQQASLALPHTAMATAADIGEPNDVHPKNKQEVGRRLALLALTDVYQKTGFHSRSPEPTRIEKTGDSLRITFRHASGGLKTRDGKAPAGFTLAGEEGVLHAAEARIEGDSVIVRHPLVTQPKQMRHGFVNYPEINLTDAGNLPVLPFRMTLQVGQ